MESGRRFRLELPLHIRNALSNLRSLKGEVDLIVNVVDSRSPATSDLSRSLMESFPGIGIVNLASKPDLSGVRGENSFDFRDQKNRGRILRILKEALAEKDEMYRSRGYNAHFQILVVGLPNVGKSTLINLLKGKRVVVSENRPGVTRKVARHRIGENLWLHDSPGIFMYEGDPGSNVFDRLFLLNAIPANVRDPSEIMERAYGYLRRHYPRELGDLVGGDCGEKYSDFLEKLSERLNFRKRDNVLDLERAEAKFLVFLRDGKMKVF